LQFSLRGARDLSIIQTPPPNRYPITTEVHGFNEQLIREAITYEVERNGQVFFIHNRVSNIYEVEATLKKIVPGIKTGVGHGQMDGPKLEKVMLDFINGNFDVLIATTIIESGLDIPNANTIIINHAENFGLSDLHQLRGRVGRSNKKAFCYLITPPLATVNADARRRLKAIEEFSDLGSGFSIAMQDLDIRGAGNMLGAEQSGFIADIGFETYHRILSEAVQELKQEEFKGVFDDIEDQKQTQAFLKLNYVNDCQIDTDLELLFPDDYIKGTSERMLLYRELDNLENEEQLKLFKTGLIDRFGKMPQESHELLEVVQLRWKAIELSMEKIILKNKNMICYFVSDQHSKFYQSAEFMKIVQFIQKSNKGKLKEINNKLTLTFPNIYNVETSDYILKEIIEFVKNN
jgi:transcription-repair coupling factor (superfamily II helicase)